METMSKDQRLKDAAFARNRRLMDQAQLIYEGEIKGIDKGRKAEKLENARRMLEKQIDNQLILECTGISDDELKQLIADSL